MNRRRGVLIVELAIAAGSVFAAASTAAAPPSAPTDFCARVSPGVVAGAIAAPELVEVSGLAASHVFAGVLWAHNDSGDSARLFAMSDAGEPLGVYTVAGADAVDWEDIATGRGPDPSRSYIYIADIGDNEAVRDHVSVYRVAEPTSAPTGVDGTLDAAEAFQLVYPDGPADAEALFVDPVSGDLFIITKDLLGASRVLRAAAAELTPSAPVAMEQVGAMEVPASGQFDPNAAMALPSTLVTAADISPDGRTVLVRTYQQVLAFERAPGESVGEALAGIPCSAPQLAEPQGEAIAFSAGGDRYFTATETQLAIAQGAMATTDPNPLATFAIAPAVEPTTITIARSTTTITTTPAITASAGATVTTATTASTTTAPATTATTASTTTAAVQSTDANVPSAALPPPTSPPANRWWIWSTVGAASIAAGGLAMVVRGRRPRGVE